MAAGTQTAPLRAPFSWEGEHLAVALGHGARALFTTRRGGVSPAPFDTLNLGRWTDDDPAAIAENRRRAAALAGVPLERVVQGRQVHGAEVVRARGACAQTPEADGVVTDATGVAALVLTADCLPVALASPQAVGMIHAGWRGLACGVLEEGVAALRELGCDGAPVVAAIGPAARGCCYEVGDEVREALGVDPCGAPATIDLVRHACERLYEAEVDAVHDCGLCTMCTDRSLFFSHRRDGPVTGRQGGMAWRPSR